ncbi:hypothetical protein L2D14_01440 [Thalassospiraceae bacterium LMO-JJ14]|nr:hypothetical protein L2D14_01440 [Thalassospiraceae bacterium LMO-JJ14]
MPMQELFMRSRNGIVATLIVITVVMYLLPQAYILVQVVKTNESVSTLISIASIEILWIYYWYPLAGLSAVNALIIFRTERLRKRVAFCLVAAAMWLFFIVNLITVIQFAIPGWLTFVLGISILAYPPYFLLRWILRDECRFSGSVLEHLAFYAAFALPQMYIVFRGMLDPKFFEFFF